MRVKMLKVDRLNEMIREINEMAVVPCDYIELNSIHTLEKDSFGLDVLVDSHGVKRLLKDEEYEEI